ncbi:hypothetical protein Tco_0387357 [Tanacetum coccineum]
MLLQYRVCHIEFSPSVVITESRQNARLELTQSEKRQIEVVHRQLILMLNRIYSTSHMVVLSNIRAYSDYDFFDGHRMQSGGRNVYLSHLHFFLSYLQVRFYLMEMDCMLSTSGWLVCELIQKLRQKEVDEESCVKTCSMNWGEANSVYTSYIVSSASNGKIQAGALIFVLVGYIKSLERSRNTGQLVSCWMISKMVYDDRR